MHTMPGTRSRGVGANGVAARGQSDGEPTAQVQPHRRQQAGVLRLVVLSLSSSVGRSDPICQCVLVAVLNPEAGAPC